MDIPVPAFNSKAAGPPVAALRSLSMVTVAPLASVPFSGLLMYMSLLSICVTLVPFCMPVAEIWSPTAKEPGEPVENCREPMRN